MSFTSARQPPARYPPGPANYRRATVGLSKTGLGLSLEAIEMRARMLLFYAPVLCVFALGATDTEIKIGNIMPDTLGGFGAWPEGSATFSSLTCGAHSGTTDGHRCTQIGPAAGGKAGKCPMHGRIFIGVHLCPSVVPFRRGVESAGFDKRSQIDEH